LAVLERGLFPAIEYIGPGAAVCWKDVSVATSVWGITLKLSFPKKAGKNKISATPKASGTRSTPRVSPVRRVAGPTAGRVPLLLGWPDGEDEGARAKAARAAVHGREKR
jgi:hypothetical protein